MLIVVAALVFVPMCFEAWRASRNERTQRQRGGIEPSQDVYAIMRVAYPGAFALMIGEGFVVGGASPAVFAVGAAIFAAAKILKWWAIRSLGAAWTFRVVVVPGDPLVATGPYQFVRHPNYVAVIAELVSVALMTHATVTGPLTTAGFGALIWKRIGVEQRALESGRAAILRRND